jgi:hypothetical protein
MNTEIVEAIEQHLTRADRVTQLWELFGKHQENIEAIPLILSAVSQIEGYLIRSGDDLDAPTALLNWSSKKERDAYVASLPFATAEQVQTIKALLKETGANEEKFLAVMRVPSIEDIREFERARHLLESRRRNLTRVTVEQVQTIKALLKETGSDERDFLRIMGVRQIEDFTNFQFDRAKDVLGPRMRYRKRVTAEQVQSKQGTPQRDRQ